MLEITKLIREKEENLDGPHVTALRQGLVGERW